MFFFFLMLIFSSLRIVIHLSHLLFSYLSVLNPLFVSSILLLLFHIFSTSLLFPSSLFPPRLIFTSHVSRLEKAKKHYDSALQALRERGDGSLHPRHAELLAGTHRFLIFLFTNLLVSFFLIHSFFTPCFLLFSPSVSLPSFSFSAISPPMHSSSFLTCCFYLYSLIAPFSISSIQSIPPPFFAYFNTFSSFFSHSLYPSSHLLQLNPNQLV